MLPFFVQQTLVRKVDHTFRRDGWIMNNFSSVVVKQAYIRFMMETYIELLIANFIAFNMFDIQELWNIPDKIAVAVHYGFIAVCSLFFIFVCWFVFKGVVPLNRIKSAERRRDLHDKMIERVE